MAIDVSLNDLANLDNGPTATATINANNAAIESALQNALSIQGTSPNQMNAPLDMNGQQILNLPAPSTVDSPVRLVDVAGNPTISVPPTGTSGAVVPFLNGANVWTGSEDFTGSVVTVTTQSPADNSTKAASTAYVDAAAAGATTSLPGLSVPGRAGTTTGAPAAITGTASQILGVNSGGTALAFETMSGDATLSGPVLTLATVNSGPGSVGTSTAIPVLTTNAKGLVTAQTTAAVIAPAGTLTGSVLASGVVTSSLTSHAKDLEFGTDSASTTNSSLQAQSISSGTNNQTAGDFTLGGGKGTGTGAGGSLIFSTSAAGSSGTTQNPLVEAKRILPTGVTKYTNAANFTANGSVATTVTSLGPAGSHTTIQKWLTIQDNTGTVVYIPCY